MTLDSWTKLLIILLTPQFKILPGALRFLYENLITQFVNYRIVLTTDSWLGFKSHCQELLLPDLQSRDQITGNSNVVNLTLNQPPYQ